MGNNSVRQLSAFYGPFAGPDQVAMPINDSQSVNTPYAGGDIGQSIENNDRTYTMVILDSGATSATPVGSLAANQLLYWKDKSNRIVTNDKRFAVLPAQANSFVAGIGRVAVPAPGTYGTQLFMLTRGYNIQVASAAGVSEGAALQADTTSGTAQVTTYSSGQNVGIARTGTTAGSLFADVDFGVLP